MKDNTLYICVIILLLICLLKSCDYARDQKDELAEKYSEDYSEVQSYYYYLYEDLFSEYERIYYEYEEDPCRTVPMSEFAHPDDVIFPIEKYVP